MSSCLTRLLPETVIEPGALGEFTSSVTVVASLVYMGNR